MISFGNIVLLPTAARPVAIRSFCDFNWRQKLIEILGRPDRRVQTEFPGIEDPLYYSFTPEPRIPNLLLNGQIIHGPIMIIRFDAEGRYPEDIPRSTLRRYKKLLMPYLVNNEFREKLKEAGSGNTKKPAVARKEW